MLAAHMDEVGFILVSDEEDGYFRFDNVGGIDVRQLPGKPVMDRQRACVRRHRRQAHPPDHRRRAQP